MAGDPLSFAQRGLWFLQQLAPESVESNVPLALRLRGPLDRTALVLALVELVARHEVLRSIFRLDGDEPVAVAGDEAQLAFEEEDLAGLAPAGAEARVRAAQLAEAERPFDLASEPPLRCRLLRLSDDEHVLLLTLHHIASDGWTIGVLQRELAALYRGAPLEPPALQYADYAVWQHEQPENERSLAYWRERLRGLAPLDLPGDRTRPPVRSGRGATLRLGVGRALREDLRALGAAEGATLFATLLAAYQLLLGRLSGASDVAVGTPVAGRDRLELEGVVGCFVNVVVLRIELDERRTFRELLRRVRATALEAFDHADVPFERLVERLGVARDSSRTPLFQATFAFEPAGERWELEGLAVTEERPASVSAKCDLALTATEAGDGLELALEYSSDLFEPATAGRFGTVLRTLLAAAVAEPDLPVSDLPLLTISERDRMLLEWNATEAGLPDVRVHELFRAQVARTPDAVAVTFEGESLTYRELDWRANRLAHRLSALGVGPDVAVGVALDRSPALAVAVLAVLAAGGAFVPVDPRHPADRLAFVLADSGARVVLTSADLLDALPDIAIPIVCLDDDAAGVPERPAVAVAGDHLAYVIFTSGSTGRPKGVQVTHRGFVNLLLAMAGELEVGADDAMLAIATPSFDAACVELLLPLVRGARVAIGPAGVAADGARLAALIAASGATYAIATPTTWRALLDQGWPGDRRLTALSGGEALPPALAEALLARCGRCWNLYGPTETTVMATLERLEPGRQPSIGRPIANTEAYVLDRRLQPVPAGVPGELLIGGAGLARGYAGRPDLTAERFVPHPYRPGARLYRTGDLVRFHADGRLDYLGRIDRQVKVRGIRIEPGEVEAALARHPTVGTAVVVAREDRPGDRRLVAYLVAAGERQPSAAELRAHLRRDLPEALVPSAFRWLDALPVTASGKLDAGALPAPVAEVEAGGRTPLTPVEEQLAAIWADVLGFDRVGVDDDFFELGGHSLSAVRIASRARRALGVPLSVQAIFQAPSVAGQARVAESLVRPDRAHEPPLVPVGRSGRLPASISQEWRYLSDRSLPASPIYQIVVGHRLRGDLDTGALAASLEALCLRHEALRTNFHLDAGGPYASVRPRGSGVLTTVDAWSRPVASLAAARFARRIPDRARDPLFRALLIRLAARDHVLVLGADHIVCDGLSLQVILRELAEGYAAALRGEEPAGPPPIQHLDWAAWQRRLLSGERLERLLAAWRRQLGRRRPLLEFPLPAPAGGRAVPSEAIARLDLPAALAAAIRQRCREWGVTPFVLVLAALDGFMGVMAGVGQVTVYTPNANRARPEVEGLAGNFAHGLLQRVAVEERLPFRSLLERVRAASLDAWAHAELPVGVLLRALDPGSYETVLDRPHLFFDVARDASPLRLPGLEVSDFPVSTGCAHPAWSMRLHDGAAGMSLSVAHRPDQLSGPLVSSMLERFRDLLALAVREPSRRMGELAPRNSLPPTGGAPDGG